MKIVKPLTYVFAVIILCASVIAVLGMISFLTSTNETIRRESLQGMALVSFITGPLWITNTVVLYIKRQYFGRFEATVLSGFTILGPLPLPLALALNLLY